MYEFEFGPVTSGSAWLGRNRPQSAAHFSAAVLVLLLLGAVPANAIDLPGRALVTTAAGVGTMPVNHQGPGLLESLFPIFKPKPKVVAPPPAETPAVVPQAKKPAPNGVILNATTAPRKDRKAGGTLASLPKVSAFGGSDLEYDTIPGVSKPVTQAPVYSGYRTVCVRLCDGYYWPISNSASMSQVRRDADICEQSCTAPAKLFYQTDLGKNPAMMRDLSGNTYRKLKTAFLYRKKLDPECRCKPNPWAKSELLRHESYAMAERFKRMQQSEGSASIEFLNENPDDAVAVTSAMAGIDMPVEASSQTPAETDGYGEDADFEEATRAVGPLDAEASGFVAAAPSPPIGLDGATDAVVMPEQAPQLAPPASTVPSSQSFDLKRQPFVSRR
jgi:hypothetical protein